MEGDKIVFHSNQCKVCISPNRGTYEEMRARYTPIRKIWKKALELNDKVSYDSMRKHLINHFGTSLAARIDSNQVLTSIVERKFQEEISQIDQLNKNLKILSDVIEQALKSELDSRMLQALRQLLAEMRLTLQALERHKASLKPAKEDKSSLELMTEILMKLDLPSEKLEQAMAMIRTGG
jgi:hypothetical protein